MSRNFLIFLGVGLVAIALGVLAVFSGTKGSHLELKGQILKARTGVLDENHSAVVLDVRLTNPSDLHFVLSDVEVSAVKADGQSVNANIISKSDLGQLLRYNRFLGAQFNEGISIRDKVDPHQTVDRTVAAQFEIPAAELDKAKSIHLRMQELDGASFETDYKMH